ncbi:MAG: hypothetical protein ASARMPREDX12_009107 [Alectoria sarmentosa]|nr:MAG: hypothetical protein ASARMPREDX12_009107 [Alectoria sarmentosa]
MTRAIRPGSYDVYLIITAYSATSVFTTDGDCVTISESHVTLQTPFSVVTALETSTTDAERVQSIIESNFVTWVHRAPTCYVALPSCLENDCLFDENGGTGWSPGASNTIVAVVVLVVVALLVLVYYRGQNHFRRVTTMKQGRNKTRFHPKPYLQPKAELDARGNIKNELQAVDGSYELAPGERYEIEGDGGSAEMPGFRRESEMLPSLMERHELRGEEHSRELDGHQVGNR